MLSHDIFPVFETIQALALSSLTRFFKGVEEPELLLAQGRNEVRWRPRQEATLAPPMFEPELFRKQ